VSLATGTLTVGRAKTDAGTHREVDLSAGPIEALGEWCAYMRPELSDPLLITRTGRRQTVTNCDHRIKGAIAAGNERLTELGIEPISERITPYSLRRTYASLRALAVTIRSTSRSSSGTRIPVHLPGLSAGREAPLQALGRASARVRSSVGVGDDSERSERKGSERKAAQWFTE
jgi:hypothetical protein